MSNSNSATDFVKKTFDTRGTTNSIASTHRDIIHPSIQRVTQNENKIQKSPSQVDWTTISSPRYVQYDSPRDTKNMVKKLKGYQYQFSVPDYLKLKDEHISGQTKHPERISVISKSNGWLTVDSQNLSRKNAYENQKDQLINRETSPLSPSWMQNVNHLQPDQASQGELRRQTMFGSIHRNEDSRLILFDVKQPLRNGNHLQSTNSIFKNNPDVVTKKDFIKIHKVQMSQLNDQSKVYLPN